MTDFASVLLALGVLVVPLVCAYFVVQRLARGKRETGGAARGGKPNAGVTGN